MAIRYITLDEFEAYRKANTAFLDDVSQRLNSVEQSASNTSVRLSSIETDLKVMKTDVASLRTETHVGFAKMEAEFTKVNIQITEVRHMMAFLISDSPCLNSLHNNSMRSTGTPASMPVHLTAT